MSTLYHYTCDHGRAAIGERGSLVPAAELTTRPTPWQADYVWLTDLATPMREALGLTNYIISCDRTVHRYRVTDGDYVLPWHIAARGESRERRDELEGGLGVRPMHWFVSLSHVLVVYDPIRVATA